MQIEVCHLNLSDLILIRNYLIKNNHIVFLALMNFGVNTGLRISDFINLKFEDLINGEIRIREKKTKKLKKVVLNEVCLKNVGLLKDFYKSENIKSYNTGYLFKSKYNSNYYNNIDKAVTYEGVLYYLKKIKRDLDIKYPIGTHSFRKTWGRTVYAKTKDVALLMLMFNHSSPRITLRYIGIEEQQFDDIFKKTLI